MEILLHSVRFKNPKSTGFGFLNLVVAQPQLAQNHFPTADFPELSVQPNPHR
jgi:hypothetical protein